MPSIDERLDLSPVGIEFVQLRAGEHLTVPAGKPHRQLPAGSEPGHVRGTVKPAGRTEEFLRYLAQLARDSHEARHPCLV